MSYTGEISILLESPQRMRQSANSKLHRQRDCVESMDRKFHCVCVYEICTKNFYNSNSVQSVGTVEYADCTSVERQDLIPPMEPLVGHGWRPVMSSDGNLVVELSVIKVLSGNVTCNTQLRPLLGLDRRSKRSEPINRLVVSRPCINIIKC